MPYSRERDTSFATRIFAPIGQRGRISLGATEHIIELSCKLLQVSRWQLAHLIGQAPHNFYRWLSGRATPSTVYLARLTQLWILQWEGLPVHLMQKIMWEESLILWKDGSVTCENHLPGGSGSLPKEEGLARWEVAEFLNQQRRLARMHNQRKGRASPGSTDPPRRVVRDV